MQSIETRPMGQQEEVFKSSKQICQRYGVSHSTPYRWIKERGFPKPIRISEGCSRWKISEIEEWEANLPAYLGVRNAQ